MFDAIDFNTADVEGLHAAHQRLTVGKAGGGGGIGPFIARCVSRAAVSQFETGVMRNTHAAELAGAPRQDPRAGSKTKRGGQQSGKQLLHSEVCREMGSRVNDSQAHQETAVRWGLLTDEEKMHIVAGQLHLSNHDWLALRSELAVAKIQERIRPRLCRRRQHNRQPQLSRQHQ